MENRHGLIVNAEFLKANGHAERAAALLMLDRFRATSESRWAATMVSTPGSLPQRNHHKNATN